MTKYQLHNLLTIPKAKEPRMDSKIQSAIVLDLTSKNSFLMFIICTIKFSQLKPNGANISPPKPNPGSRRAQRKSPGKKSPRICRPDNE